MPALPGRDIDASSRPPWRGRCRRCWSAAVDPADQPNPAGARGALGRAGFIVSLEIRPGAVTAHADVVLPVAPVAEKAGRFVAWEGRRRPFDLTLTGTG